MWRRGMSVRGGWQGRRLMQILFSAGYWYCARVSTNLPVGVGLGQEVQQPAAQAIGYQDDQYVAGPASLALPEADALDKALTEFPRPNLRVVRASRVRVVWDSFGGRLRFIWGLFVVRSGIVRASFRHCLSTV